MKVVLFCGGMGMRIREYSEVIPKPLVPVGNRPILWNVMKYYAHFGHRDFILCLGYKGEAIKDYFLNYSEAASNDFVMFGGPHDVKLLSSDIHDWKITFVDTGLRSNIGQRLKAAEKFLEGEEIFIADYTDGLTDLPFDQVVESFVKSRKIGCFVSVIPNYSFDVVRMKGDGTVEGLQHITKTGIRVNAGYFVFKREIFEYMRDGEELVYEPFRRLVQKRELMTFKYDGFFVAMDTFKEKQIIDEMYLSGKAPWEVWKVPPKT
jgi:glucose-1-phosphate cytidylyltransferase